MSRARWSRATVGLAAAEFRGAAPMAEGLLLTLAVLIAAARSQFEVAPEAMLGNRAAAWAIIALAAMVPLAAELFGASGRGVQDSVLQPLPVRRSQVFAAKLAVLMGYLGLAWIAVGAVDAFMDQVYPPTKLKPDGSLTLPRIFAGTAVLALFVTALTAATIKNALGSTLFGLVSLVLIGTAVVAYTAPPYRVPTFGAWGLTAAYYAVHPLILALALAGLYWASALRGRGAARTTGGSFRRSLAVIAVAVAAPVAALATSAVSAARSEVLKYQDPSAGVGMVIPSPAGDQLLVNLTRWQKPSAGSSWIVDVDSGAVRQTLTARDAASKVPFSKAEAWGIGWSPDGRAIGVEVESRFPWMQFTGTLNLQSEELEQGSQEWRPFHEATRWHHAETEGYAKAMERFRALSCEDAIAALEEFAPRYLYLPRRNESVAFGLSRGEALCRFDGATGALDVLASLPKSPSGDYRVDPRGVWVASFSLSNGEQPPILNSKTGEYMGVPDGWFPSGSSFYDIIVRDDAVLVSRPRPEDGQQAKDWAWLRAGELGEVLPGLDARRIIDLDGDRMVAVSYARKTIELLDRDGRVLRTLRAPASDPPTEL